MPELHLPEMSREDIGRALGDAAPDIDLTKLDPRRLDLPDLTELTRDISRELAKVDVPKAVAAVTTIGRARRAPSRVPFVIAGVVTLAIVGIAIATSPMLRPRFEAMGRRIRARMDEIRADAAIHEQGAHAFDAAETMPVQPSPYGDDLPTRDTPLDGPSDLPDGLGVPSGQRPDPAAV